MPGSSERVQLLEYLYAKIETDLVVYATMPDEDLWDSDDEEQEELFLLNDKQDLWDQIELHYGIYMSILNRRYLHERGRVQKQFNLYELIMGQAPEDIFRQQARMSRRTFNLILERIQRKYWQQTFFINANLLDHPIFISVGPKQQKPVRWQLLVALNRFGQDGNGAAVGAIATKFGIGHGTVILYHKRVTTALIAIADEVICWPDAEERREIATFFGDNHGFTNCVGTVDGTVIPLNYRPIHEGDRFTDRKSRYSLSCTAVVDPTFKIRGIITGLPGSVADSNSWKESSFARNSVQFFDEKEYLLGDCGYSLGNHVLTPYRKPQIRGVELRTAFNHYHSCARVIVERTFGLLKMRFMSLRCLRGLIRNEEDMNEASEWVTSCVVLHNLIMEYNDEFVLEVPEVVAVNPEDFGANVQHNGPRRDDWRTTIAREVLQFHGYDVEGVQV